jgi:hypothetical protein
MDKYSIVGEDGLVDVVASAANYSAAVISWKESNEIPSETIAMAMGAVFEKKGARMHVPQLIQYTVGEIGATSDNFKPLTARVKAFVKAQVSAGKLFVKPGATGGISLTPHIKK